MRIQRDDGSDGAQNCGDNQHPRSDVEMLAGIQGTERDAHAETGCGTETHDEKHDRQFSAMVVVQEINSPGKQEGGCCQGWATPPKMRRAAP